MWRWISRLTGTRCSRGSSRGPTRRRDLPLAISKVKLALFVSTTPQTSMRVQGKRGCALGRAHDQIRVVAARDEIPPIAIPPIRSIRARAPGRDALLARAPLVIAEGDDMRNVRIRKGRTSTDEQKAALQTGA